MGNDDSSGSTTLNGSPVNGVVFTGNPCRVLCLNDSLSPPVAPVATHREAFQASTPMNGRSPQLDGRLVSLAR
ncbi:MAG: hypothetical protein ICV65_15825 [Flavisolibacter sp.]|nr:hypothetical protein [Flavisolibacter sp.]